MNWEKNLFEESILTKNDLPEEWRNQKTLDEFQDFLQANWELRNTLFVDSYLTSKQQFISFTGSMGMRTNNYIGTIVYKNCKINIFPKVFKENKNDFDTSRLSLKHLMANLRQWLEYCEKFSFKFVNISSELDDCDDFRELLISIYLRYVDSALEVSPLFRYEERTSDLNVIRGKIDFNDYIRSKIPNGKHNELSCKYSEFEFDNMINRIIKYTCKYVLDYTSSNENKRIVRNALYKLSDVKDIRCTAADCDGIRLNKLQSHYSIIVSMSKIFLLNQTNSFSIDDQESFCFLFPSEYLFEGFISGFMRDYLNNIADVSIQANVDRLVDEIRYAGRSYQSAYEMRNDILINHPEKGLFVLDTKYKEIPRFDSGEDIRDSIVRSVKQSDLYQVTTYALKHGLSNVYLLYPLYRFEDEEPTGAEFVERFPDGTQIGVHALRIPFVFENDEQKTKDILRNVIESIIEGTDTY